MSSCRRRHLLPAAALPDGPQKSNTLFHLTPYQRQKFLRFGLLCPAPAEIEIFEIEKLREFGKSESMGEKLMIRVSVHKNDTLITESDSIRQLFCPLSFHKHGHKSKPDILGKFVRFSDSVETLACQTTTTPINHHPNSLHH